MVEIVRRLEKAVTFVEGQTTFPRSVALGLELIKGGQWTRRK